MKKIIELLKSLGIIENNFYGEIVIIFRDSEIVSFHKNESLKIEK